MKRDKTNTNSTVDDRERRTDLKCSYCRPNKGENEKRKPRSENDMRKAARRVMKNHAKLLKRLK